MAENHVESNSELAQKLERDLDSHIEKLLEKNKNYRYEDGFNADGDLDKELQLIPAFSEGAPTQEEIDASPALQALQALKYETEDPEACALSNKEDGNYEFERKNYKKAIIAYSEALRCKHNNTKLYAVVYTNRAAAHFYLGNNGSALKDAIWALKFEPEHMKAIVRAATCCYDLEKYDQCLVWCSRGLKIDGSQDKLKQMKKKSITQQRQKERDDRKRELRNVKNLKTRNELINTIVSRKIKIGGQATSISRRIEAILDASGKAEYGKINLDENKNIHWPFYFIYPEFSQSDFIEDYEENISFIDQLSAVFEQPAPWDRQQCYTLENIELFFEDTDDENLVRVRQTHTLKDVVTSNRFTLNGGAPMLMVFSKVTSFYKETFENQKIVQL